MSKKNKDNKKAEKPQEEPQVEQQLDNEQTQEQETNQQDEAQPEVTVEQLQQQLEAQQKEYLLLMAEFDNFRRRTLKEKQDIIKNAAEKAMVDLLPVVDDFERALDAMSKSGDVHSSTARWSNISSSKESSPSSRPERILMPICSKPSPHSRLQTRACVARWSTPPPRGI